MEDGAQSLVDLAGSGRSVTVLTNSLAANDVAAVYSGYARYRTRLLRAGVHAYELKPDPGHAGDISVAGSSRIANEFTGIAVMPSPPACASASGG